MRRIIYRLGSHPKRSLRFFLYGLALFALSVVLIALGYVYQAWLQLPGLIILAIALGVAGYGYLGIFANRFSQVLSARDSAKATAKKAFEDLK
ncbi:hypothetical protein CWC22_001600 [Pseudoalteromonas rubra]|uniref:Uncharacterized protein n=1 Tax=Pseudoalteromonas rubra TaxID=43658 RepID=A0A5S3UQM6_9GAMM|nr:hypothetical protein [Pseudoalteromonas rubra]QPB81769.1 hypothetical protein CWC22_001600 [Pseudoalteromonas rubra]